MTRCAHCDGPIDRFVPARLTRPGVGPDGRWHVYPAKVWTCSPACSAAAEATQRRARARYGPR